MSTLRDVRQPDDFKKASHDLLRQLKTTCPELKLGNVQSALAKALGARSLNALLAQPTTNTQSSTNLTDSSNRQALMEYAQYNWFFIALKSVEGDYFYLHTPEDEDTQNFRDTIDHDVALMTQEKAEAWLARTAPIGEGGYDDRILRPLGNEPLLLFSLFLNDAKSLEQLCRQTPDSPSGEFPFLGMDIDAWDHESINQYTRLGYYEWVVHQLDRWLTDQTVLADTEKGTQS